MASSPVRSLIPLALAAVLAAAPASAQYASITQPPSGDNQYASVTQGIGLVRVTVTYNSPDVHGPFGEDRRGKIFGGNVVPWGLASYGFTCGNECPWRGGANENTVFTTSHDVKVQGEPLPAGSYGLHFIAGPEEWTVIFSKVTTAWGSYYYDGKDDALRVKAKPAKGEYREWLTYEFTDRKPDRATLALQWEDLQLPLAITVENMPDLYIAQMREDLKSHHGFDRQNWAFAARYALQNRKNLDEALAWAERATQVGIGQPSFDILVTLGQLQEANGKAEEARKTIDRALNHPEAIVEQIHQYARSLQLQNRNEDAMKVFELNARRFPQSWVVHVGLARGYSSLGRKKEALAAARKALELAPDAMSKSNVEAVIRQVEGT